MTQFAIQADGPARYMVDVTPSDTTVLEPFRGLWVGTTGDVAIVDLLGVTHTITNVPVGMWGFQGTKVMETNTTADGILALY